MRILTSYLPALLAGSLQLRIACSTHIGMGYVYTSCLHIDARFTYFPNHSLLPVPWFARRNLSIHDVGCSYQQHQVL